MDIDMSRPGTELFPESNNYSSNDVTQDQFVGDPLNTGVTQQDVAGQQLSDKEMNFRALRDETAKLKEEASYWRGQAEAYAKVPTRQPESVQATKQDALNALDLDDSRDVRKAFDAIRQENIQLREEIKDALTAIETKSQRQDWNNMVTQHVPQLTSKNPIFAEMIRNASNPYEAAYLLAELNSRASTPVQNQNQNMALGSQQTNGQRALANASKPQTLATVGGQGQLSAADYYASMSDEDFHKIASRNLAGI